MSRRKSITGYLRTVRFPKNAHALRRLLVSGIKHTKAQRGSLRRWQACRSLLLLSGRRCCSYRSNRYDAVKTALSFYDKYNGQQLINFRNGIGNFDNKNHDKIMVALNELNRTNNLEKYEQTFRNLVKLSGNENDIDMIIEFFDGLSECISTNLCDWNTAVGLFQPKAMSLYTEFAPYIIYNRVINKDASYGYGIENIQKLAKKKERMLDRILEVFD